MNGKAFEYGILTKNSVMQEVSSSKSRSTRTVLLGQIVKVETELANRKISVRLLKDGETWDSCTFFSTKDDVIPIPEKLWPFLAAISSPMERVKLANNKGKCEKLMQIGKDMTVGFSDMDNVYLGKIKFIGNVKGMGKCVGIQLHVSRNT